MKTVIKYLTIILIFASTSIYPSVPLGGLSEADKEKPWERSEEECYNILNEGGFTYERVPFTAVDKEGHTDTLTSHATGENIMLTYTYKIPYPQPNGILCSKQHNCHSYSMHIAILTFLLTQQAAHLFTTAKTTFKNDKKIISLLIKTPGKLTGQKTPASAAPASAKK